MVIVYLIECAIIGVPLYFRLPFSMALIVHTVLVVLWLLCSWAYNAWDYIEPAFALLIVSVLLTLYIPAIERARMRSGHRPATNPAGSATLIFRGASSDVEAYAVVDAS